MEIFDLFDSFTIESLYYNRLLRYVYRTDLSITPLSDRFNCIQESKITITEFMEKDEYFEIDINIASNVNEEE